MKTTYAYIKYAAPKTNKRGSYAAAELTALCLGVTLNLTDKDRYIYKQAEIQYPEDRFCLLTTGERRDLVDTDGEAQDLNALLDGGLLRGRMFRGVNDTVIFACRDDLTSGQPKEPALTQQGLRCPECRGSGQVTKEYLEQRAAGEALRQDRLLRGASLREDAYRLGIAPQDLSDREHGRLRAEGEAL